MNVSDILDVMGDFSIGGGNVTDKQRSLFLKYLKIAYDELITETALFNEALSVVSSFKDVYDTVNGITIAGSPFLVSSVFDVASKKELLKKTKSDALKIYTDSSFVSSSPKVFSIFSNMSVPQFNVFLYPAPTTANVLITWVKNPDELTEITQSYELPFPPAFHKILADGGLWYVFQEEGGFKDSLKAKESKARWEIGKQRLKSFLFNSYEDQGREALNV